MNGQDDQEPALASKLETAGFTKEIAQQLSGQIESGKKLISLSSDQWDSMFENHPATKRDLRKRLHQFHD